MKVVAFLAGLLFAVGLALSGMTNPRNVLAFLDVRGAWDPALALVMMGAISVYASIYWLARKRMNAPVLGTAFAEPTAGTVNARLVIGSLLFGIGWGVVGYCPGPALVALATGAREPFWFSLAMIAGFLLTREIDARRIAAATASAIR
jgi:uncharacterized protein